MLWEKSVSVPCSCVGVEWVSGVPYSVYCLYEVFDMASPRLFRDVQTPVGVARAVFSAVCIVAVPGDLSLEVQETEDLPRAAQM